MSTPLFNELGPVGDTATGIYEGHTLEVEIGTRSVVEVGWDEPNQVGGRFALEWSLDTDTWHEMKQIGTLSLGFSGSDGVSCGGKHIRARPISFYGGGVVEWNINSQARWLVALNESDQEDRPLVYSITGHEIQAHHGETGTLVWSESGSLPSTPLGDLIYNADDELVHAGQANYLQTFDANDGAHQWDYDPGQNPISQGALIPSQDTVCFGYDDSSVRTNDTTSGALDWNVGIGSNAEGIAHNPTNSLVVAGHPSEVFGLAETDGSQNWSYSTNGCDSPITYNEDDNLVYFGSGSSLIALDASNGAEEFEFSTPSGDITGQPAFNSQESLVYFGTDNGEVYAADATAGTQTWNTSVSGEIDGKVAYSPDFNFVYAGSNTGSDFPVVALDELSGDVAWSTVLTINAPNSPLDVEAVSSEAGLLYVSLPSIPLPENSLHAIGARTDNPVDIDISASL